MEGWIKLHRKMLDSDIIRNAELLKIWIWVLLKCAYEEGEEVISSHSIVKLKKGQFVTCRRAAARELDMEENIVYRRLKSFEKKEMIKLESDRKKTIITVTNWDFYQNIDSKE